MSEKKLGLNEAYSLKTPKDSVKLYKKWAQTYDTDFALNSNYQSPKIISNFYNKHANKNDTPILDVGAGTGLVGEYFLKFGKKNIIAIDISQEMLRQAESKKCYSSIIQADLTKKLPLKNNSMGAIVSAGTFTHGHVGPNSFDELLRVTKPGGLFILSINTKVFKSNGFEEKFKEIKKKISTPKFIMFNAHAKHKDKKFSKVEIFASIFRKNKIKA